MKLKKISPSKIKTNLMCEFKYYLSYHLGLDLGTSFAAEQGSMVHIIFEKFGEANRDGIKNPEIKNDWYEHILYAYQVEGLWKLSDKAKKREKKCDGCCYNKDGLCFITNSPIDSFEGCPKEEFNDSIWLVEKIINDKTIQNPLNKKVLEVEDEFEIIIKDGEEEIPIIGLIDVVNELDDDTIEIVDYKTGNHIQSYKECKKDPQLLIYHLAARKKYRQYDNIFITIYYLRSKPMTFVFLRQDEEATEKALKNHWYKIKHNKTPKRICDRSDGTTEFGFKCKYLCSPEICEKEYKKFVKNGHVILPERKRQKERKEWLKKLRKESKKDSKMIDNKKENSNGKV